MAQSYIVPKIGTKGKFDFKPPFNKVETLRTQYTVQAIRSLKELKDSDEQPYEQIYAANGITEEEFKDDLNNNVPILCLIGNGDEYLYVPANRVKKLPDISGVKYQEIILAISLGHIPYGTDLSVTKDTIVNNVYDTFGVTSTIEEIRGSAITMVEDVEHETYMRLLKNKRKESLSYKSKYDKLLVSYNNLREHLDCLTDYIQNNCCGGSVNNSNTLPIYSQITVPDYNYMDKDRIVVHGSAEEFPNTGYASQLAQYGLRIAMDPKYNPDPNTMCPCLVVVKSVLETLPMVINYRTNEIEFGAGGSNNSWDIMLYGYWFRTPDGWKPFAVGQLLNSFKNIVTRFNENYKIPFISGLAIVETNPPIDHYMSNTGNPFNNLNRLPFGANSYTGITNNATALNNVNSDYFTKYLVKRHDTLGWTIYDSPPGNTTLAINSLFNTSWKKDVINGDTCLLGGTAGRSNSEELAILYTNIKDVCDYGTDQLQGDYPRYGRMKPLPNRQYDIDNRICDILYPPLSFKDLSEWRFSGTTEDDWLNNKVIIFHEALHGVDGDYTTLKNSGKLDSDDKLARPYSGCIIDGTSVNVRIPRSMGDHNLIQSPATVNGWNVVECGPTDIPMDSFWFPRYVRAFRAGTTVNTSNLTRVAAPIFTTYEEFVNAGNIDKYYDTDRPGYVTVNGGNWIFKWLPVYDIPLSKCRLVKDGIYKGIDVAAVLREYETSTNGRSMNTTYPPNVDLEVWIPNFDESQYQRPTVKGKYAWVFLTVESGTFNSDDTVLTINNSTVRFDNLYGGSVHLASREYTSLGQDINTTLDRCLFSNGTLPTSHSELFNLIKRRPVADVFLGNPYIDKPNVANRIDWYGNDLKTALFIDTIPKDKFRNKSETPMVWVPNFATSIVDQSTADTSYSSIIPINDEDQCVIRLIDNGIVGASNTSLHMLVWDLEGVLTEIPKPTKHNHVDMNKSSLRSSNYAWLYLLAEGFGNSSESERERLTRLVIDSSKVQVLDIPSYGAYLYHKSFYKLGKDAQTTLQNVLCSNTSLSNNHSSLFNQIAGRPVVDIVLPHGVSGGASAAHLRSKGMPWFGDNDRTKAFLDRVPDNFWRTSGKDPLTFCAGDAESCNMLRYTQDELNSACGGLIYSNDYNQIDIRCTDDMHPTGGREGLHMIAWRLN